MDQEYNVSARFCWIAQTTCTRGCMGSCKRESSTSSSILPTKPAKNWKDDVMDLLILAALVTTVQLAFIGLPVWAWVWANGY